MNREGRIFFSIVLLLLFGYEVKAQPAEYPKNYFRNPLEIPMDIQSNFGELRPDHWHMGLDIRTAQKENQPVYAAAEGYVASIGIRGSSFGRFIIINHPNGLSTLYAHLNDFNPQLEEYVTDQQYKNESWATELSFTKNQFPVSKGQFIAFSVRKVTEQSTRYTSTSRAVFLKIYFNGWFEFKFKGKRFV